MCDILNDSNRCFTNESLIFEDATIKQRAREVAQTYGVKLQRKQPLGFDGGQLLIVFCDTCPNNSLPVLWCSSEPSWTPLFRRHWGLCMIKSPCRWLEMTKFNLRKPLCFIHQGIVVKIKCVEFRYEMASHWSPLPLSRRIWKPTVDLQVCLPWEIQEEKGKIEELGMFPISKFLHAIAPFKLIASGNQ